MTNHAMMGQARSQCGGQGFDPPLLQHLVSMIYGCQHWRLFLPTRQYLDIFSDAELDRFNCHYPLHILNSSQVTSSPPVNRTKFQSHSRIDSASTNPEVLN
jgi:hypothetical protein